MRKHGLRRLAALLAACMICILIPGAAFADLLPPEPTKVPNRGEFYSENQDACSYERRFYTANGPDGWLTVYDDPVSAKPDNYILNGEKLYVFATWPDADGIVWAMLGKGDCLGWAHLDALYRVYTSLDFHEDYAIEIEQVEPAQTVELSDCDEVLLWRCPGSDIYRAVKPADVAGTDWVYRQKYVDAYDNIWVYSDSLGGKDTSNRQWLCLSQPDNPDLPAADFVNTLVPPVGKGAMLASPARLGVWLSARPAVVWAGVLVLLVIVLTAILIPVCLHKRKRTA